MKEQITDWIIGQDSGIILVIVLTIIFFCSAVFLLSSIIFNKFLTKREDVIKEKYWSYIRENLAYIAIQSVTKEGSEADYDGIIKVLSMLSRKSKLLRQLILEELIQQKSNLTGDSLKTILKVYRDLDLQSHSLKKLKSLTWNKKAEGIHELERMDQREVFTEFYKFLNARNRDLRVSARMALTTLSPSPLDFLDHIDEELNEWEQMAIYRRLKNQPKERFPNFSKYFQHKQPSVVAFCIDMTVKFNHFELVPQMTKLLRRSRAGQRINVIKALRDLEAYQSLNSIKKLIVTTKNIEVIIECLKFLGQIGNDDCKSIVAKFMKHSVTLVKMEAVEAAIKLNLEFDSLNNELERMFEHHKNKLIT